MGRAELPAWVPVPKTRSPSGWQRRRGAGAHGSRVCSPPRAREPFSWLTVLWAEPHSCPLLLRAPCWCLGASPSCTRGARGAQTAAAPSAAWQESRWGLTARVCSLHLPRGPALFAESPFPKPRSFSRKRNPGLRRPGRAPGGAAGWRQLAGGRRLKPWSFPSCFQAGPPAPSAASPRRSHRPETPWGRWHNGVGAWEHPGVPGCPATSCPAPAPGGERQGAQPAAASSSPGQGILLWAVSREGM